MGLAVDGFELLDAHLGVNGRGFELFVAEKLLDEADVGPDKLAPFGSVLGFKCFKHWILESKDCHIHQKTNSNLHLNPRTDPVHSISALAASCAIRGLVLNSRRIALANAFQSSRLAGAAGVPTSFVCFFSNT